MCVCVWVRQAKIGKTIRINRNVMNINTARLALAAMHVLQIHDHDGDVLLLFTACTHCTDTGEGGEME